MTEKLYLNGNQRNAHLCKNYEKWWWRNMGSKTVMLNRYIDVSKRIGALTALADVSAMVNRYIGK